MLRRIVGAGILITLFPGVAAAQSPAQKGVHLRAKPTSLAITYNAERAKTVSGGCNCFWFQGGAVDANWNLSNHLGVAAQFSGGHASNIGPGVDISKIDFLVGPRYTQQPARWRHYRYHPSVFGEFLVGGVHAFDTVIPTRSGTSSSATAFGLQTGAGANLWLMPDFGIRLFELDYVYSRLPNAANSTQSDFRIATGVTWHLP